MSEPVLLVICNAPNGAQAERMAQLLVDKRLAACVNILDACRSIYRWHGAVEATREYPMLIKTSASRYPALEALLRSEHPYDLPEIVALPLTGSTPYLDWVRAETQPERDLPDGL